MYHQQLEQKDREQKGRPGGPLPSSAHLKENRSLWMHKLSLSKEELKFLGGRTSRGPAVVGGAVLLGRRMGHRCGSDWCAEQF